jgi:hypothetical protein
MSFTEIATYYLSEKDNAGIEVRIEDESVWLTQSQIVALFDSSKQNISLHINNVFKEKELDKTAVVKYSLTTASDGKKYKTARYNLDVIISVGYRIKSNRGTQFRIWATRILRDYLIKGYAVQQRIEQIERKVVQHDKQLEQLIQNVLPPQQGIFYEGQIFDAHLIVSKIMRSATKSCILIDNYIDESVLYLFNKCKKGVSTTIYTRKISKQLEFDLEKYNSQFDPIEIVVFSSSHDRFLIIDEKHIYHIGASLKDLGKKWFAFSKLSIDVKQLLNQLKK